jgi:Tfp pilus assembly protein FimT
LVVIVIIAVVASIALMQRGSANQRFQRQNVALELKAAFERARFDSVKRHADTPAKRASVLVNGNSFTLTTGIDEFGTPGSGVSVTTNFASQNISISQIGFTFPVKVAFNRRGEVVAVDSTGTAVSPEFLICNGECRNLGDASTGNANVVFVTPTGTVNLLAGGSTPPNFNAPPVTSIPGSNSVSNLVYIAP